MSVQLLRDPLGRYEVSDDETLTSDSSELLSKDGVGEGAAELLEERARPIASRHSVGNYQSYFSWAIFSVAAYVLRTGGTSSVEYSSELVSSRAVNGDGGGDGIYSGTGFR